MTINSLKELEKLVRLCRKTGIQIIKVDGIELVLTEQPTKQSVKRTISSTAPFGMDADTKIETPDDLSPEELLYYSAGGPGPIVGS